MSAPAGGDDLLPAEDLRLPEPPGWLRRFWARHPVAADRLIALHVVPLMYSVMSNDDPADWVIRWFHLATLAVLGTALLFRRRHPVPVTVVAAAATAAMIAAALNNIDIAALPVALYTVTVYHSPRAGWIAFGCSAVLVAVTALLTAPEADRFALVVVFPLLLLVSTLIGVTVAGRRRYTAALVKLAEQLAVERDQQARLAAAAERARIAREMHDIIAHSLSVIVALTNGADAVAERAPEQSRQAIREARNVGRNALADMRRLLGVLRDEEPAGREPDRQPQPAGTDLAGMVESFRAAGMPVALSVSGPPLASQGMQLTVHRIVQESLTNVLRYATHPTRVSVQVVNSGSVVDIDVQDNGRVAQTGGEGAGKGLIGMRERVALYGGSLEVGPGNNGGWHVHATLRSDERKR